MKVPQPSDCRTCRYKCNVNFTEEDRGKLCSEYWKLGDYARQKDFILSNVDRFDVQRQRTRGERKRTKTQSVVYSFKKGSEVVRVCKRFFLKTIDISHGPLITALKGRGEAGPFMGEDRRGRHTPANKASGGVIQRVKTHIESFPQIESHYTRSGSRRCYLDQKLSINKMYRLYKVECEKEDPPVAPVGAMTYRRIFCNGYNLSLFRPRKDQCSKCSKFKILEGVRKKHSGRPTSHILDAKKKLRWLKLQTKWGLPKKRILLYLLHSTYKVCYRYQAVMCHSCTTVANCAFTTCVFTVPLLPMRLSATVEVEGGRGSNEIGTCLFQWLSQLPPTVKEVSFYSDTCGGQNRNQNVAALLMYAVQKTQVETITHNFLESGHSYMECDSMHSAIECEKKYVDVYTMIDWVSIFRRARRRHPYTVINIQHSDVLDLQRLSQQTIKNRKQDEDGKNVNWLLVKFQVWEGSTWHNPISIQLQWRFQTHQCPQKWSGCTVCWSRSGVPDPHSNQRGQKKGLGEVVYATCDTPWNARLVQIAADHQPHQGSPARTGCRWFSRRWRWFCVTSISVSWWFIVTLLSVLWWLFLTLLPVLWWWLFLSAFAWFFVTWSIWC